MHADLLRLFVERGVITNRTEIDALYRGHDLGGDTLVRTTGTFLVLGIMPSGDGYTFTCASTIDGQRRAIPGTAIRRIDGMDPERLAANFNLTPEGVSVKVGKRRGRKPKNRAAPAPDSLQALVA